MTTTRRNQDASDSGQRRAHAVRRAQKLFGPLDDHTLNCLIGRESRLRAACRASGLEHLMPPVPPAESDPTLARAAAGFAHLQRLAGRSAPTGRTRPLPKGEDHAA